MKEPKFTPGPWYRNRYGSLSSDSSSSILNHVPLSSVMTKRSEEAEANTSLVSAAPDMHEALAFVVREAEEWIKESRIKPECELEEWVDEWYAAAKAALSKAGDEQ